MARGNLNCIAAPPSPPALPAPAPPTGPDACGCPPGYGWSVTTGTPCCRAGSITQVAEEQTCHANHGNMNCQRRAPRTGVPAPRTGPDACGCPPGYGWSLTTGTPCCKAGSLTQAAEEQTCHANHGNMNCQPVGAAPSPPAAAGGVDRCGCPAGYGWSLTTGAVSYTHLTLPTIYAV